MFHINTFDKWFYILMSICKKFFVLLSNIHSKIATFNKSLCVQCIDGHVLWEGHIESSQKEEWLCLGVKLIFECQLLMFYNWTQALLDCLNLSLMSLNHTMNCTYWLGRGAFIFRRDKKYDWEGGFKVQTSLHLLWPMLIRFTASFYFL